MVYAREYADPADIYRDGYLTGGSEFGIDLFAPGYQEYLAAVNEQRVAMIEAVSPRRGTLLDVGCGSGELLAVASSRGWSVTGVEPVDDSAKYARDVRGLNVKTSVLQKSGLPENSFDVVTLMHVAEHMVNVGKFIRIASRWARPGGTLVVEVPNYSSWLRWRSGESWFHLRPLEHVVHFTPRTLRAVLRGVGLEDVAVSTPNYLGPPMDLDAVLSVLNLQRFRKQAARLCHVAQVDGVERLVPGPRLWPLVKLLDKALAASHTGMVAFATAVVP